MMDEDLMTVKEFATFLKVHTNTIYKMIRINRLQVCRLSGKKRGRILIPKSEVKRLFQFNLDEIINEEVEKRLKEI